MKNIDISNLNYKELCELEAKILNRKKEFVSLESLYIYCDSFGKPHLCYIGNEGRGRYIFYTCYYTFYDIFTDKYIIETTNPDKIALINYLNNNQIDIERRFYLKEELKSLWEPIRIRIITNNLNIEQEKPEEKRMQLLTNK